MCKVLIICGPTATGKTDLGMKLARKFDGEVVNADSRQLYRGMDIVTGKDIDKNAKLKIKNEKLHIKNKNFLIGFRLKEAIPIWLVDLVEPDYVFNVGEYRRLAFLVIENIWQRKRLPIVVGGTGLYIKSLIDPLSQIQIAPDPELRKKLEKWKVQELATYLMKIDKKKWQKMNASDRLNPRRLIRAIEISSHVILIRSADGEESQPRSVIANIKINYLLIGLKAANRKLYKRIDKRVEKRIKQGAVEELKKLFKKGYDISLPSMSATGYRELKEYIDGKISLEEAVSKWKYREHSLARRQLTWFNKMSAEYGGFWFDIKSNKFMKQIEETVWKWYTK